MKDRLIEYSIPYLSDLNEEARKEKLGAAKPPIFELTYWWTRKPLSVCRALILASIAPKDFDHRIFREVVALGKEKRAHNYNPRPEHLKLIREIIERDWGGEVIVLDPFAGGGSIPFEALRLGIPAIAIEYNPVAWLLLKVLEWCQKYGDRLINVELFEKVIKKRYRHGFTIDTEELCKEPEENLKKYGDLVYWGCKILNKLKEELSQFYPDYNGKRVAAYIWVRQVRCPNCGAWIPLTRDWYLSRDRNVYFVPVYEGDNYRVEIRRQGEPPETTVIKGEGEAKCPKCGHKIGYEYIRERVKGNDRLIIVVTENKEYFPARESDIKILAEAEAALDQIVKCVPGIIPDEEFEQHEYFNLTPYGYRKFSELFNKRQLLVLVKLVLHIRELARKLREEGYPEDYVRALIGILSLLLSKHADYNSAFTHWHSSYEVVGDTLAFRRPAMTWNYVEVNPFAKFSGSLWSMFADILEAIAYATEKLRGSPKLEVIFGSALRITLLDKSIKLIVTDPPYYDDVPYAELSDFLYVWLKRVLSNVFPEVFGFYTLWRDRSSEELSVGGYRDEKYFEVNLIRAFKEIRRVLRDDGLLVLFFAHSSLEAWERVLKMLLEAGFQVIATHPVRTESPESVIARGKLAIESSIVIVCRPRITAGRAYIEELYPQITDEVRKVVEEAWRAGYRGADLIVTAFGAALRVITRYSEIKSYSGKSIMGLLSYVYELVPTIVAELALRRPLGSVDKYTAFYLYVRSVREYYSEKTKKIRIGADEFIKLSRCFKLTPAELVRRKLAREAKVGGRKGFEILTFEDRQLPSTQVFDSIIDALHYLLQVFKKQGGKGVQLALQSVQFRGFTKDDMCDIANALVNVSAVEDEEVKLLKQFCRSVCGEKGGTIDLFLH